MVAVSDHWGEHNTSSDAFDVWLNRRVGHEIPESLYIIGYQNAGEPASFTLNQTLNMSPEAPVHVCLKNPRQTVTRHSKPM